MIRRTFLLAAALLAAALIALTGFTTPGAEGARPRPTTTTAAPTTTTTAAPTTTTTTAAALLRDLAVTQTSTGTAALGQPVLLTTVVTNVGTTALPVSLNQAVSTPDTVRQLLPAGHFTLVSATGGPTCQLVVAAATLAEAVRCTSVATLAPGASATIVTEFRPLVAGKLTLLTSVPPPLSRESNYNNNFATYSGLVPDVGPTDVAATASGAIDTVFLDQVNFGYVFRNDGPWGLSGVTATVTSPNGFWFTPGGCTVDVTGRTANCRTGPIAAGGQISNGFTVKRAPDGSASMTVTVTPPVVDSDPTNNRATASL